MSSYDAEAIEATSKVAVANLHTLTVSMASMQRLLCRLDSAGELMQANADLVEQAIEATRAESRQVDRLLKSLMQDRGGVEGAAMTALGSALITINELLDALEGGIRHVNG